MFVDEVHRFNKAQQDAFLPHVEAGHILFIGATTENPSFEVISPLLSRTKVYVLESLTTPQIVELLRRALTDKEHGLGGEKIEVSEEVLFRMAAFANGDARAAYNTLELCVRSAKEESLQDPDVKPGFGKATVETPGAKPAPGAPGAPTTPTVKTKVKRITAEL